MVKQSLIWICATSLALSPLACRRQTYSTKDGSVTVENKGGNATSLTFSGRDGKKVTIDAGGGKVPDNYPKDVPIYKSAKVVMTQSASEKNMFHLMLESPDAADSIGNFYKKELESNGWKIEGSMTMGEMNMFTANKEKRQVVIQISNSQDKRTISQIVSQKN